MGEVKADYNWQKTGRQVWYDEVTYETLLATFPVHFQDDFLGYKLQKYVTNENTSAPWHTVATNLNLAPELVADTANGVAQITVDSDDNAEHGTLYWGDNNHLDLSKGLIFETRLTFAILPTTGTEIVEAVWGLADDDNAVLDSVATNAWFKVISSAQTALLYESDDGDTDDNDNAAGITLVAGTYNIFRIDATDVTNVRFFVDGVHVGSTAMSNLTAAEAMVQPYFTVMKAVSANNTGTGTMYIDYCRVWQNRS